MFFSRRVESDETNVYLLSLAKSRTTTIVESVNALGVDRTLFFIVLFGSLSRGEATRKSDIDLLMAWEPMSTVIISQFTQHLIGKGVEFVRENSSRFGRLNIQHMPRDDYLNTDGRFGWIRVARQSGKVLWSASDQS